MGGCIFFAVKASFGVHNAVVGLRWTGPGRPSSNRGMSTIAHYLRATEATLESLRGKTNWIDIVQSSPELRAQLVDVDKAVFGLEWLLSRRPAPVPDVAAVGFSMRGNLAGCLMGGGGEKEPALRSPIGPGRTLPPAVVREFEAWLRPVDLATLQPLFDASAMMDDDVYPLDWDEPGILDEYLMSYLEVLKVFFARAAAENQSVLMFFL